MRKKTTRRPLKKKTAKKTTRRPYRRRSKKPKFSDRQIRAVVLGAAVLGLALFIAKDLFFRTGTEMDIGIDAPRPTIKQVVSKPEPRIPEPKEKSPVKKEVTKELKVAAQEKEPEITLEAYEATQPPQEEKEIVFVEDVKTLPVPITAKVLTGKYLMAIVLDDWGHNYATAQEVYDLNRPMTFAIIPHLPNSFRIAKEAHERNLGVMVHLPMQPFSETQPLEPQTVMVTTPDNEIVRIVDEALTSISYAEGVNNHMGSAATSNLRVMETLVNHLKKKKLFFMDSNTTAKSVASKVADQAGIAFIKRDIFIDNIAEVETIKTQLRKAKSIAKKTGQVVVIGHDKRQTIRAIREIIPEFERDGIEFVLVKDLV